MRRHAAGRRGNPLNYNILLVLRHTKLVRSAFAFPIANIKICNCIIIINIIIVLCHLYSCWEKPKDSKYA